MHERVMRLLEMIACNAGPVSASELATMTGVPRASIYRILANLQETGAIDEAGGGGRYVIGARLIRIVLTGKPDSHIIRAVAPIMRAAVSALGETAFFARYRGGRIEIVHVETPTDLSNSFIHPGTGRRPVHACSSAKAIAAFISPELREDLIDPNPIRYNERTIVEPALIRRELSHVQRDGFAVCDGEIDDGVTSVAVPVIVRGLGALFSIGVVGPSKRVRGGIEDRIVPVLQNESIQASAAIRHCSTIEAENDREESIEMARASPFHAH